MPTPAHLHPEQSMEPPDGVEPLECPECDHEMEYVGGGIFECQWPFCDNNSIDPKQAYENLGDYLYDERRAHNGLKRIVRGMLKCIGREQLHGSAAFKSLLANAEALTSDTRIDRWMKYYLAELRAKVEEWRIEARKINGECVSQSDWDKGTWAGGAAEAHQRILDQIDEKKPEKN